MKRILGLGITIIIIATYLVGCGNKTENEGYLEGLSETQKIEVQNIDDSSTLFSLTDSKEIDLFIQNLKIEQWEYSSIPDDLGAKYEFLMYQEGAKRLLTDSADMNYVVA